MQTKARMGHVLGSEGDDGGRTPLRSRMALRSLSSFSFVMTTLEGSRPTFTVAPFT